jgi:hypothetical protein
LGLIILYLFSTATTYFILKYLNQPPEVTKIQSPLASEEKSQFNISGPKTEECPLNGAYYSVGERKIWEQRRPLGVMIENHKDSRPQSGLSKADIIYEVVAEGGITRFLAIYYCDAAASDTLLGPIRSARTYYLDWISEYDGLYVHVGGAGCDASVDPRARALCQIDEYGIKDINQMGRFGSYPYFWRDYDKLGRPVATEHTMHSTTEKLWEIGKKMGWEFKDKEGTPWNKNFTPWKFKQDDEEKGKLGNIQIDFWRGFKDYQVRWEYDPTKNQYKRFNGGKPHIDFNNKEQLTAKVVIVQEVQEIGPIDAHKHLLYKTIGSGKLLVFQDGKVIKGKWVKEDRVSRTLFYDSQGKEVKFNRGKIWVEIVPDLDNVVYSQKEG